MRFFFLGIVYSKFCSIYFILKASKVVILNPSSYTKTLIIFILPQERQGNMYIHMCFLLSMALC